MKAQRANSPLLTMFVLIPLFFALSSAAQQSRAPEAVDLRAPDGINLKATYFAAAKPAPAVLLLHQCNRQRKVWDGLAERLAASGFNVLTLDYRGYGESGGTPVANLSDEERIKISNEKWAGDVDTAFQYLVSRPGVARDVVGVGGASCGVNQSIQLARRHPEVKSLVLLSGDTNHDGRQFLRNSTNVPLFFSAADDDGPAVEIMQWLFSLSHNPANKFQRYAVGGHGIEMFAAHKELPGIIVDWFDATLRTASSVARSPSGETKPAEPNFLELVDQPDGVRKAAKLFAEARQRDPKAVLFSEAVINGIGYEHMQSGDTKGAVEIMKLNVSAYPNSANAYDSLSDAYLADDQHDLARQSAKKALALLAADTALPEAFRNGIKASAERKLKQLGETPH
jgi:dienelactone hydrolase